jgi:HK97 family phage portal protein
MRVFGLEVRRTEKAVPALMGAVSDNRGWFPIIREAFAGAWQKNLEFTTDSVLAHHAVYACVTLIATDIGKLRTKLVQQDEDGIWVEENDGRVSPVLPVLRKPNRYQNQIQFKEWWITSKLLRGNAYALKERDRNGTVVALYLLDPMRVQVLVAPDGSVYYQLSQDYLSGLEQASVTVPASEIIHDRMNCLFHPLVGVSPIYAGGHAANIGLKIEANSVNFFAQNSNPGGVLTAPGTISQDTAKRLKEEWEAGFGGENSGRTAVLGDGLKFEAMRMTAVDSQTIQHLRWSAETVCAVFHVPPFKVGIGTMPTYQNAELLNQIYYSDCLQAHIESFEAVMDEGLDLVDPKAETTKGIELDIDALLRMDTATQMETLVKGVSGAVMTPNEARKRLDLAPIAGGNTVYQQVQNYSLAALDARDRAGPAPGSTPITPTVTPADGTSAKPPMTDPAQLDGTPMDAAEEAAARDKELADFTLEMLAELWSPA